MKNGQSESAFYWENYHDAYAGNHSLTTSDPKRITGIHAINTVIALTKHLRHGILERMTFLDYGCGTGRLAKFLAPLCRNIICTDISSKFLETAKGYLSEFQNVDYLLVNPECPKIPSQDGEIDFVYSYASLSYTTEHNFWAALNEIDRVSKNFCVQINSTPNETPEKIIPDTSVGKNIFEIQGYRPKSATLFERFPESNYFIERLTPEIREGDRFFFKIGI